MECRKVDFYPWKPPPNLFSIQLHFYVGRRDEILIAVIETFYDKSVTEVAFYEHFYSFVQPSEKRWGLGLSRALMRATAEKEEHSHDVNSN